MSEILKPQQGILFMKVGVHAQEDLDAIIARKLQEIEDAGFALWGYGGNTCHPTTMVQPFAKKHVEGGQKIYLCMQEMTSKHFAEPIRAEQYSVNGRDWQLVPEKINVRGSRYALAIRGLRKEEFDLPLTQTVVAVGNSTGRTGRRYIQGRVDKACLEITEQSMVSPEPDEQPIHISLVAELCEPYAVFLKD